MVSQGDVRIIRTRSEMQDFRADLTRQGLSSALVPTMGALHEGHLSLVRRALDVSDCVVASIFVNPTQFAPNEDFSTYPRNEGRDLQLLESAGCRVVYCPEATEIYPVGDRTRVLVHGMSQILEGEFRPHFFEGVATVVSRLFVHVQPDVALFGEKDFQQLQILRRMTVDLGFRTEILGCETQRQADGLALSSRNAYLSETERSVAVSLFGALTDAVSQIEAGASISGSIGRAKERVLEAGFDRIDYISARVTDTLEEFGSDVAETGVAGRLLAAAWLGKTRLIDNLAFQRR